MKRITVVIRNQVMRVSMKLVILSARCSRSFTPGRNAVLMFLDKSDGALQAVLDAKPSEEVNRIVIPFWNRE